MALYHKSVCKELINLSIADIYIIQYNKVIV